MRLFRLKLNKSACQFWFLNEDVHLDEASPISSFINADRVDDEYKEIIEAGASKLEVYLIGENGEKLPPILSLVPDVMDLAFDAELDDGASPDEFGMPQVVSVTVDEPEPEEEAEIGVTEDHLNQARIILKRNGNTVKKILRELSADEESHMFLMACLEVEAAGQARKGVLAAIREELERYV